MHDLFFNSVGTLSIRALGTDVKVHQQGSMLLTPHELLDWQSGQTVSSDVLITINSPISIANLIY